MDTTRIRHGAGTALEYWLACSVYCIGVGCGWAGLRVVPVGVLMDRPVKVRISNYIYEIEWHEGRLDDENGHSSFGTHDPVQLKISIRADAADSVQRQTMLHELLHACWYVSPGHAIAETFSNEGLRKDADIEEIFVQCVEAPLLGVLTNNPRLLAWLTDTEVE